MESSNFSALSRLNSNSGPGCSSSLSSAKHFYCMVNNVPDSFHTSDLRNFFSEYIEGERFDMFHFRHRPQIVSTEKLGSGEDAEKSGKAESSPNPSSSLKRFCCLVRFNEDSLREKFIRRYDKKLWMDKEGNDLPIRCIITKVSLSAHDLQKFANKELHPPKFMPRGNVGTSNGHFLNLIRECRLPPSLIKKLDLEFPRARVFKRYSKVPPPAALNKGTRLKFPENEDDEDEEVKTGKGHSITEIFIPDNKEQSSNVDDEGKEVESDKESNADDDDDRCEEWERHEALHDHRTTHGDMTSESKERLYEEEIELKWEKGGPGIVWYTDAQFWDQQRGGFDERTADDWDVDMEGYYEAGGGDKDAQDLINMRRSERVQQGLETVSVIKKTTQPKGSGPKPRIRVQLGGSTDDKGKIGLFEKHTRGVGRKVMEKFGWKDGEGLGKTIKGIPDALENEGQGPGDKRGFGYYGEKLDLGNPTKRRRDLKDYDIEANDRIVIGTIYDKPEDLDIPDALTRRNAPTFIKRYDFCRESKSENSKTS